MDKEMKQIINRLKRSEGQIRGVQNMIAEEKECVDVITQLTAIRSSIDRVMGIIVANNLKECLLISETSPEDQAAKIEQAIQMIVRK